MSQDDVLCRGQCEGTVVWVELGDIAGDCHIWISLDIDIILERDELVDVSTK